MDTHPSDTDAIRKLFWQESAGTYLPQIRLQSFRDVVRRFEDESMADRWLVFQRCLNGVVCPRCHGDKIGRASRPIPHRCRVCRIQFSVKAHKTLWAFNLRLSAWIVAFQPRSTLSAPARIDIACRIDEGWKMRPEVPELTQGSFPVNPAEKSLADSRSDRELPPPAAASPEQLAAAFFCLTLGHTWQYAGR